MAISEISAESAPPVQAVDSVPPRAAAAQASAKLDLPMPAGQRRVLWAYAIPIAVMHGLALLAVWPWLFSWTGLIVMLLGIHVFGQGITLCYHRLLSHRSFKVPRWFERLLVVVALCCMQDTPAKWVAAHRVHHNHSDDQPDPHSPLVNFLWSHIGWLIIDNPGLRNRSVYQKFARDLLADPFYMRLEKQPWLVGMIYLAHAMLFAVGGAVVGYLTQGTAIGAWQMGLSLLVWGVIVRTVVVWHITWSVNSLTHLFGYRNYDTDEHSHNNWLVAILTVGEGWHNNHHHDPAGASVQHRWWELDITYYEIRLLGLLGLAYDIVPAKPKRRARQGRE